MTNTIKTYALLLIALTTICAASCKKSNDNKPVSKPVVLTTDSITHGAYTLIFINKDTTYEQQGGNSRKAMESAFFIVYPEITAYFNPSAPHKVKMIMDPAYDGVAFTVDSTVTISTAWMLQYPKDIDVVTHEVTHVSQQYHSGAYTPTWLVEGLADYSRNKFGVSNAAAGWYLPDYTVSDNYTDGYTTVARFLVWVEAKYKPGITQILDSDLRAGTYSDDATWQSLTGYTFAQLWNSYTENPYF